jgi:uncharacterized protein
MWRFPARLVVVALLAAGCEAGGVGQPASKPSATTPGGTVTPEPNRDPSTTPLHTAAAAGDLDALRAGITGGLDLDARDADGRTPVMAATLARRTEAVRMLLEAGADVDIRDDRLDNPFLLSGAEGLLDILRLANEAGADPALTNRFGGTALIPAAERGHVEVVRYLLAESDVDVDHVNRLGWTALLEAIILSDGGPAHQEIVGLLLEHGADPALADAEGVTPLEHARTRGYQAIVAMLEAAEAE